MPGAKYRNDVGEREDFLWLFPVRQVGQHVAADDEGVPIVRVSGNQLAQCVHCVAAPLPLRFAILDADAFGPLGRNAGHGESVLHIGMVGFAVGVGRFAGHQQVYPVQLASTQHGLRDRQMGVVGRVKTAA